MVLTKNYKRVYVWEIPVRIFHWINAAAITVLIITGLIIANPPAILTGKEASQQFWFGYIREIHFISAYLMVAVMVLRIYWAFKGNRYANAKAFFPFNKEGFHKMWHILKHDIFLIKDKNYSVKNISIGHNNIAVISYLFMFIMALIMIFTGFGLYADNSSWFLPKLFKWVPLVLGGDFNTRVIHHYSMWAFILFIAVHIYLVLYHDWLEGRGETSSMISGYKFVRNERFKGFNPDLENREFKKVEEEIEKKIKK